MWAKLKKFDIHTKALEGVHQQTIVGAVLTVITTLIVIILLVTEISAFMNVEPVSRMVVDKSASLEAAHVTFDVTFQSIACDKLTFAQEITKGTVHTHEEAAVIKRDVISLMGKSGCQVSGSFVTDKTAGNFKFGVASSSVETPADLTHTVNNVAFLPTIGLLATEEQLPNLTPGFNQSLTEVAQSVGVFQYSVQVVPTQYKALYGELSYINQYSILEKVFTYDQLSFADGFTNVGGRGFVGVIFTYDFYPVMLFMEERRERIVDFISNLFGIVGGVITVLSLIEGLLHHSTKALIGKKD